MRAILVSRVVAGTDDMSTEPLKNQLLELEAALQRREVRADAARLRELLSEDFFELGVSGITWTREAVIAALGQEAFSRLVSHAYERGIRFFETAESYVTPAMLAVELKPYPRDSYVLMNKVTTDPGVDPAKRFDDMRRLSQTEYFDIMLLHWQHTGDWVNESARWRDGISEAQAKQTIKVRGVSVHGLPALRLVPGDKWLEVAMIRMNHNGTRMDGPSAEDYTAPGNVNEVVQHVKLAKSEGMGVISMKLAGDGTFTKRDDRQKAVRFAFQHAGVDCVTIGFKSPQELDEAFDNINLAYA